MMLVLLAVGFAPATAIERALLESALGTITTGELRDHAGVLADDTFEGRAAGSRGGQAAAKYILHRLQASGLKTSRLTPGNQNSFTQTFHGNYKNLLALIPGNDDKLKHEFVLISAHYDHVGYGDYRNSYGPIGTIHNGADDNASGTATLLELIDALSQTNYQPRRSILFAFWDGEENGLLGSRYWIRNPTTPLSNVKLAINIDMVGRLRNGRIEVVGSRSGYGLRQLLCSPEMPEKMWLDFTWEMKDNSDHWSFIERGIPAVCLHTGLHDDYHRPSDDIEKLNITGMEQISRYLLRQLCTIAESDTLPHFRASGRSESPASQRRMEPPLAALPPRLGISWKYLADEPAHWLVTEVQPDSPASLAGLQKGDHILSVDAMPTTSKALLPAVVLRAGSEVVLSVRHRGKEKPETITIALLGKPTHLGLSWRTDQAEPQAVYATRVVPFSPAARAGIRQLDRIYRIDGESIHGQDDFLDRVQKMVAHGPKEFRLTVESHGVLRDVIVPMALPQAEPTDLSF